jgi:hypothetical protein
MMCKVWNKALALCLRVLTIILGFYKYVHMGFAGIAFSLVGFCH